MENYWPYTYNINILNILCHPLNARIFALRKSFSITRYYANLTNWRLLCKKGIKLYKFNYVKNENSMAKKVINTLFTQKPSQLVQKNFFSYHICFGIYHYHSGLSLSFEAAVACKLSPVAVKARFEGPKGPEHLGKFFEHETPGNAFSYFLGHENGNFLNQKCW